MRNSVFEIYSAIENNKKRDNEMIIRQSYYITIIQQKAVGYMSVAEGITKGDVVKRALDAYIMQINEIESNNADKIKKQDETITRQTYLITEYHRKAIAYLSYINNIYKSDIVKNALDHYIPDKYYRMAKENLNP